MDGYESEAGSGRAPGLAPDESDAGRPDADPADVAVLKGRPRPRPV